MAAAYISALGLQPHPEGGFYKRVFTSSLTLAAASGPRAAVSSIYYLCPASEKSSLHELRSDELWFWHAGDELEIVELSDAGVKRTRIGCGVGDAETINFSHAVPAGTVFGAKCVAGSFGFSLVSCAVAPGFDFRDWKMDNADDMRNRFRGPEAEAVISELAAADVVR